MQQRATWQVAMDAPDADGSGTERGGGAERGGGSVLAVVGGCGGAGTSSLAAACAVAARSRGPVALVDLDVTGGGLDVLLGIEDVVGARWPDLYAARGHVDPDALLASLPRWRQIPVLSADRRRPGSVPADVRSAVLAALRACAATVVLDVPPAHAAAVREAGATDAVLVVPTTVVALAHAVAVTRIAAGGPGRELSDGDRAAPLPRWGLVVQGRARGRLHPDDVAEALEVPRIAKVRRDRRARDAVERGSGPRTGRGSPLRVAAESVLRAVPAW